MKHLLLILSMLLLLIACDNKPSYDINGTISSDTLDGQVVYLKSFQSKPEDKAMDSAVINKNTFTMKGSVENPDCVIFSIEGQRPFRFFIENSKIDINIDLEDAENTKVSGSQLNDVYVRYTEGMAPYRERINELRQFVMTKERTPELEAEVDAKYKIISEEMLVYSSEFAKTNPGSMLTGLVLSDAINGGMAAEEAQGVYDKLDEYVKNSNVGKDIEQMLRKIKTPDLEVGQAFRDLKMKTPDDKDISIADYVGKDKYVLLDFWASWCGPCRRENPNIVRLYNEYKEKGFEIVGVSLDESKEKWIKGIEEDGITWPQMSDIKGWLSEAAVQYKIAGIPFTVLLDKTGNIIDINLRGEALEAKLKELMP